VQVGSLCRSVARAVSAFLVKNSLLRESAAYSTGAKGNKWQTEPCTVPRQQRSNWFYVALTLLTPIGWHLAKNIEDESQELLQ